MDRVTFTAGAGTGRSDLVVDRAEVATLSARPLAEGGNSRLWPCLYRGRSYLFKEYRPEYRAEVDIAALRGLIGWRRRLATEPRRYLDTVAAWPRFAVTGADGGLLGVLVPRCAPRFLGRWPEGGPQPRTVSHLVRYVADGRMRPGAGPHTKRRALGNALAVLLWFHAHGVLVNDVHAENVLCTQDGRAVYFVDCDVMVGAWGEVCPPPAPPYVREVVPAAGRPTYTTDLARMTWAILWVLLDDFALTVIGNREAARLDLRVGRRYAEFLVAVGRHPRVATVTEDWQALAADWAAVADPPAGRWVPDRYRQDVTEGILR